MVLYKKRQRATRVNNLLKEMSFRGCHLLSTEVQAAFDVDDRGRVWYTDSYTGKRIYTHYSGSWKDFSLNKASEKFVRELRDHISKGKVLDKNFFDALMKTPNFHQDLTWGYSEEDLASTRRTARKLFITREKLDIEELRESEEDCGWGNFLGFYCFGHVNLKEFAIQANHCFQEYNSNFNYIKLADVRHVYYKVVREGNFSYWSYIGYFKEGFKPITIWEE